jgi:hypothetical protein
VFIHVDINDWAQWEFAMHYRDLTNFASIQLNEGANGVQ